MILRMTYVFTAYTCRQYEMYEMEEKNQFGGTSKVVGQATLTAQWAQKVGDTTAQHPPVATKWARPLLLHAACSERIPFVRTRVGVGSAKRVFCPC